MIIIFKRVLILVLLLILLAIAWANIFQTGPVYPQAWETPANKGYEGDFKYVKNLEPYKLYSLGGFEGSEHWEADAQGRFYTGSSEGKILRINKIGDVPEIFADTQGLPLGLAFDSRQHLWVADAKAGLLEIDQNGEILNSYTSVGGESLGFTDALAIDKQDNIYFTDASQKFSPRELGAHTGVTYDLLEHGLHGRVYKFNAATKEISLIKSDLQFPNGLILTKDETQLIVLEMGMYRVFKIDLNDENYEAEIILDEAPGMLDNITPSLDGNYWIGLSAPRDALLDATASMPWLRRVLNLVPPALLPYAKKYPHIIKIDQDGNVLESLQNADATFTMTTGVQETPTQFLISSLIGKEYIVVDKQ